MTRRAPPSKGRRAPPASGRGIRKRGQFFLDQDLGDTANLTESRVWSVTKILSNTAAVAESLAVSLARSIADAMSVGDQAVLTAGKGLSNSVATADSGSVLKQDYCDITYFSDDYVGAKYTF